MPLVTSATMASPIEKRTLRRVVIYPNVSWRISRVRRISGLNRGDFAKRIGISPSSVSGIERGDDKVSERLIVAIASVFNVREDWLRYNERPMEQKTRPPRKRHMVSIIAAIDQIQSEVTRLRNWVARLYESEADEITNPSQKS
jgi:transcriptional regulator with XRE-family HTH domain